MKKEILLEIRRKEKRRKLLITICIPICIVCFGYFAFYYQSAAKSASEFQSLAALKNTSNNILNANSQINIHKVTKGDAQTPDILPEYETLYNKNKRLIGWIKIDDTIIDCPVMHDSK